MKVDTNDIVSVSEANSRGVSKLISDAESGRPQVVLRNGKAVAAIVDIARMDRLQRLDDLEDDLRLLSIALIRSAADIGRRHALDDVLAEAGIDPGSLDDDED